MEKKSVWKTAQKHIMTGIGYMIPVIVAANIISGLVQLIGSGLGWDLNAAEALTSSNMLLQCLAWIKQVAAPQCQNLMYPVFAAYLSWSIADRQGLTMGFFGGLLAYLGNSGFIGALIIGFAAGYFMKWLSSVWTVSRQYRSVMNMMIYPLIGAIFVFLLSFFVINPLGNAINQAIQWFITTVGAYGTVPMVALIGGMMGFDCGGPVNKAAFAIGYGLAGTGFTKLPVTYGAMIAPLGFGLAVFIDKLIVKKHLFSESLQGAGIPAFILGLFNVTEGALPLVMDDPLWMVPINVIGSAVGSVAGYLAGNFLPIDHTGNVLGFFLQENPLSYIACLFLGALVVAVLTLLRRMMLLKKGALQAE